MTLSLTEAAQLLSGWLPFARDDQGAYAFSPEELDRVFSAERRVDPGRIPFAQLRIISPPADTEVQSFEPPNFEATALCGPEGTQGAQNDSSLS